MDSGNSEEGSEPNRPLQKLSGSAVETSLKEVTGWPPLGCRRVNCLSWVPQAYSAPGACHVSVFHTAATAHLTIVKQPGI